MNLIDIRNSKGITSLFVSKQLNVSVKHFWRIEHGEGYLTDERIDKLAKLYGVKKSDIEKGAKESEGINGRS